MWYYFLLYGERTMNDEILKRFYNEEGILNTSAEWALVTVILELIEEIKELTLQVYRSTINDSEQLYQFDKHND
jgi:hypothetical protein